jgi:hypothetical protein
VLDRGMGSWDRGTRQRGKKRDEAETERDSDGAACPPRLIEIGNGQGFGSTAGRAPITARDHAKGFFVRSTRVSREIVAATASNGEPGANPIQYSCSLDFALCAFQSFITEAASFQNANCSWLMAQFYLMTKAGSRRGERVSFNRPSAAGYECGARRICAFPIGGDNGQTF